VDFYPPPSIHLREQGVSTVRVCVDAKGRLTSDPTTLKGSGSARLDEGALKLARAGSGHYRAATEDGQPVGSCYPLGIRFQLKN
jgi:TonB family protein